MVTKILQSSRGKFWSTDSGRNLVGKEAYKKLHFWKIKLSHEEPFRSWIPISTVEKGKLNLELVREKLEQVGEELEHIREKLEQIGEKLEQIGEKLELEQVKEIQRLS